VFSKSKSGITVSVETGRGLIVAVNDKEIHRNWTDVET